MLRTLIGDRLIKSDSFSCGRDLLTLGEGITKEFSLVSIVLDCIGNFVHFTRRIIIRVKNVQRLKYLRELPAYKI